MNKEKEFLAQNPIKYKVGDKCNFFGTECILDGWDASGNSAPLGYLFARRYNKPDGIKFKMVVDDVFCNFDVQTEPMGEVLGIVSVFDGTIYGMEVNFPHLTLGQVVALYHQAFPRKTLLQKFKELFCG